MKKLNALQSLSVVHFPSKLHKLLVVGAAFLLIASSSSGQTYYSECSCDFATAANWNTMPNGSGTSPANLAGVSRTYIVQNGHAMTLATNAGLGNLTTVTISAGGSLAMTGSSSFRGTANSISTLNISGNINFTAFTAAAALRSLTTTIFNGGQLLNEHPTAGAASIQTFIIHGGGVYVHDTGHSTVPGATARQFRNSTNGGNGDGTILIHDQGTTAPPSGVLWGNVIIDLTTDPGAVVLNLGRWSNVAGNFTVLNTQGQTYRLSTDETTPHVIGGSLTVNGATANLTLKNGTGTVSMTVNGTVNLIAGQFNLASGTGVGQFFAKGDVNLTAGTLTEASTGNATFQFNGTTEQVYSRVSTTVANTIDFSVANGAIVNVGTSTIEGGGTFTMNNGATLKTAHPAGITSAGASGSVQVTGARNYGTAANFIYTGTSAQVTGIGLPANLNNLTASASGGLSLSSSTTLSGNLAVTTGTFDLGSGTVDRASSGGSLTLANGAMLRIGGTNTYPANYLSHTLGVTSTVEYYGTAQTIAARSYGHLIASGTGVKTLGGATNITGDLTVSTGTTFDLSTFNFSSKNATVALGAALNVNNGTTFKVTGSTMTLAGTLNAADNSTFAVSEGTSATLAITGTASFWDFTSGMITGTTVTGSMDVRGTLQLNDGVFDVSGAAVVLRSTATETGRLGPVSPTASYTGNMKIERYIPAGFTNWRLLGSPITGRKVNHWIDDFTTAGFPGSHVPWFDDPPGSAILWPSIRWYDETNTGINVNDGLVGVSSNNQFLTVGQGFAAWCGDNLVTTNSFVVDLENNTPVIASTPIALPLSYTVSANPVVDGWNLVSNPLPSPVAFDQIYTGSANLEDYVTYYNPATGNTAVWDISLNNGTNGATNTIQSMQGFFLKANAASPAASVQESDKVSGNGGGMFGLDGEVNAALRLRIASAINTFNDETVVVFHAGTPALEGDDVLKYTFGDPNAPQVAAVVDGQQLAIDAYGGMENGLTVPVTVNVGVTGTYTLTLTEVGDVGITCITLEDLAMGTITPMSGGASYSFEADANDDPAVVRFILHATTPSLLTTLNATCGGQPNGSASVAVPGGPVDVSWFNEAGELVQSQTGVTADVALFSGLDAGSYTVRVSTGTCGDQERSFFIEAPFVLEGQGDAVNATCTNTPDGGVDLLVLGGTLPYSFLWNDANASTSEDLVAAPGAYAVTVTDGNGCTWTSVGYLIGSNGPSAVFTPSNTLVVTNEDVLFTSAQGDGAHAWDFGDTGTSTEASPVHDWALPGTYTVTHTVTVDLCIETSTVEVTVEIGTGVGSATSGANHAWATPQGIMVEHKYPVTGDVHLQLLDATGRLHLQRRMGSSRTLIPSEGLSTGVWFVQLAYGDERETLRVPLLK